MKFCRMVSYFIINTLPYTAYIMDRLKISPAQERVVLETKRSPSFLNIMC